MLFLGEPTTGFDPSARLKAWDLVDRLRDLGATILLTTHYLDEAEHLADRVVVIDHGRIVAQGTSEQLTASAGLATVISFRLPENEIQRWAWSIADCNDWRYPPVVTVAPEIVSMAADCC
jgi:ABC-type multidrug transport system ATPase subunit